MIDLIKFTPIEYSKQSRDYQILCRLYTILYNNVKMYIDSINVWNNKIDNSLVTLKSRTINFIPKHVWDLDELEMVVACFKYLMRNKGTAATLKFCINILMKVQGITDPLIENAVTYENGYIVIRINSNIVSLGVIEDLIDYLIPAGCTYRVIKYAELDSGTKNITNLIYDDSGNNGWFAEWTSENDPRWSDKSILDKWNYFENNQPTDYVKNVMTVGDNIIDENHKEYHNFQYGAINDNNYPYSEKQKPTIKTNKAKRRLAANEKKKIKSTK